MSCDSAEKLTVKVTIALVENPDLFLAMRSIRELRRRSTRIRDLAIKGLLSERHGSVPGTDAHSTGRTSVGAHNVAQTRRNAETVDAMLDWDSDPV